MQSGQSTDRIDPQPIGGCPPCSGGAQAAPAMLFFERLPIGGIIVNFGKVDLPFVPKSQSVLRHGPPEVGLHAVALLSRSRSARP
jgi:hypothetical protein